MTDSSNPSDGTATKAGSNTGRANIGVTGMAVMGSNLARNLASREGNSVAIHNRTTAKTEELAKAHPDAGFIPTETVADFADALARPRTAIIMVKAGAPTDAVIDELAGVFEPGDIIVDGGNADFRDTIRRERALREQGINFVGCGISGGEEGALNGPSLMPGGSAEAYTTLGPILESIAARAEDGSPCVTHVGTDGAGHFVKMVHNGIEYADMQLIGEAYDLLRRVLGKTTSEIADIFNEWNAGELNSYLIEITADVLRQADPRGGGEPLLDKVLDAAGAKGTGSWTVQIALGLGVPVSGIAEAVFARSLSSDPDRRRIGRALPGPDQPIDIEDPQAFIDQIRDALYAAKIIAYAQGFDLIAAGALHYGWEIQPGEIARIWRAGCIIRARFLDTITAAYAENPDLITLLEAPVFADALGRAQAGWRTVVSAAVASGVPVPAFSTSLAYYDALRSPRLPAALTQLQRDFFGAHTYARTDDEGMFHTLWSGDRAEVRA